jgi:hypothetical protein
MTSKTLSDRRPCTGGEPPTCCQPPLTAEQWAATSERMAARERQLRAVTPRRCPACGADAYPLFWVDCDVFACDGVDCHAIFSGRGD